MSQILRWPNICDNIPLAWECTAEFGVTMVARNPYLCLAIVGCLGLCAVIGTTGIIVSGAVGRGPEPALIAIISACIGSLSSFLVGIPKGSVGVDSTQYYRVSDRPEGRRGGSSEELTQ